MTTVSVRDVEALARNTWCRPGENLAQRAVPSGHIGSTVGTVRSVRAEAPQWPLPTRAVAENRFHDDEWAHDPSIWGWAYAAGAPALALHLTELLTAGRGEYALLITGHRLAVAAAAPGTLTVHFETGIGAVRGFRALGVKTVNNNRRSFLHADFTDGSALSWLNPLADKEAVKLRQLLGR